MFKEKFKINKRVYILAIIAASDVLVMLVPFYLKNVIPSNQISKYLGITPDQFSQGTAIYGYVALLSYVFGGFFADHINLRKLAFWGMAISGILDLWYGFIPFIDNYKLVQLYIIFSGWSFCTCFIFWSALWKLLSQQGTKAENGYLNGMEGSLNGIIGTILLVFAYGIFMIFDKLLTETLGKYAFSILVFIFTAAIFINAWLLWQFVPEKKYFEDEEDTQKFKIKISDIFLPLKNYKLLIVTILIMGVYMYQTGLSVYMNYLDTLGVPAIIIVAAGLIRTYLLRSVIAVPAGKFGDKTQKYTLIIVCGLFISTLLTLAAILIPGFEDDINHLSVVWKIIVQVLVTGLFLCLGATSWFLVTNRWATIYELKISQKEYAMSVGFISFIAFSPDAWFWQVDSLIQEHWNVWNDDHTSVISTKISNQISLTIICAIGIMAMFAGIILLFVLHKQKKRLAVQSSL
ncbi:MFS transporter [Spiroplasma endosymbiont of Crioceris asparagi]|uniref:MFS transporter n=1 Tax=Spiroplasma endosymbiont of Crioceris asparagi TaxID=3066286 RepID=UPI0030CF9468